MFEDEFITPAGLSKKLNISLELLESMLETLQVPTLQFHTNSGSALQEIIDRRFELKIKMHLNRLVAL